MARKRFYVEQRASQDYPWQLIDVAASIEAGPISIHRTKREAETARYELKKKLRNDARMLKAWASRRTEVAREAIRKAGGE